MPKGLFFFTTLLAALSACSPNASYSPTPIKPGETASAKVSSGGSVAEVGKPAEGDSSNWSPGLYYINLADRAKSCDARKAGQAKPNETWVCITRAQYKTACQHVAGFTVETLNERAKMGTPNVAAKFRSGDFAAKIGWGSPGDAREDACYAAITMDVEEMGRMEHFDLRYRIDSYQVGDKPGEVLASDLS